MRELGMGWKGKLGSRASCSSTEPEGPTESVFRKQVGGEPVNVKKNVECLVSWRGSDGSHQHSPVSCRVH